MVFLNYHSITIKLHPSIPSDLKIIEGKIDSEMTLLDGLISLLSKYKQISDLILDKSDVRPGYLLLSDKVELKSTGKLNFPVLSDMEIRIIPISHGG